MFSADKDDGSCEIQVVHGVKVAAVRSRLPNPDALVEAAERFKVLGDPTRLKILLALSQAELCVCDLASTVGATQPAVSQHLKILRAYRFVQFRRHGRMAFYRLADPQLSHLLQHVSSTAGNSDPGAHQAQQGGVGTWDK